MANPNQHQNEPQQPQRKNIPANEDQEQLNPYDFKDVPPPVIRANTEGEGDDAITASQPDGKDENQGEGNRDADRNYRKGVKQHLKKGNVEKEGKDAANALDDDEEREELEDAEESARKGRTLH